MQVVWTAASLRDLAAVREFLAAENPRAATRQVEVIIAAVSGLLTFPRRGRPGRIQGTRELIVARTPYLVPYRIRGDAIEILRILHGRQRWPDRL